MAFLAQSFCGNLIIADYYLRTSTYALRCENTARPAMHCNGKCQMMKKLKQEENNQESNPEGKPENKNELPLFLKFFIINAPAPDIVVLRQTTMPLATVGKPAGRPGDIFHPPKR